MINNETMKEMKKLEDAAEEMFKQHVKVNSLLDYKEDLTRGEFAAWYEIRLAIAKASVNIQDLMKSLEVRYRYELEKEDKGA